MNRTRTSFLPQGLLLILPVLILASVGLYSLREDRAIVEKETAERAAEWARDLGTLLWSNLASSSHALFPKPDAVNISWTNLLSSKGYGIFQTPAQDPVWQYAHQEKPASVYFRDGTGNLIYPPNIPDFTRPHLFPLDSLQPAQLAKWEEARDNEYQKIDTESAINSYQDFLATNPGEPFRVAAQYSLALLSGQIKDRESARKYLDLVGNSPGSLTESGIPFSQLAACQLSSQAAGTAHRLRWEALVHPSLISPQLLEKANSIESSPGWRELWELHEKSRALAVKEPRFSATNINNPRWFGPNKEWLGTLIQIPGDNLYLFAARTHETFDHNTRRTVESFSRLPRYISPRVTLYDKPVLATDRPGKALASFNPDPALQIEMILTDPAMLYAQTSRRRLLFGTLIAAAVLTAALGLLSGYAAHRRHIKLSEMKSNFVSSVSHELRAPIASMRLMAEALLTGRAREAKQREYFGFITQECRRLSTLIENVLNVSRIEENRKNYELAPADFPALVKSTIQIMEPAALERSVSLACSIDDEMPSALISLDCSAVQQALVNLIDNAIKHSPPGGAVTVGLSLAAAQEAQLWVEDQGEGIPEAEQERIFERFYRVGSELRRKTQGVGIGLSIVKHVADGHGARICVRSAPGKGSRFTILFPVQNVK